MHNLLWIFWSYSSSLSSTSSSPLAGLFPSPYPPRQLLTHFNKTGPPAKHIRRFGVVIVAFFGAMSLELFDFPPFAGVIDAHSLWHLGTACILPYWWNFLIQDALWLEGLP